ncbi:MAG: sigma 54-interacting transcriptional regulator [Pseudomonadota bacterium]
MTRVLIIDAARERANECAAMLQRNGITVEIAAVEPSHDLPGAHELAQHDCAICADELLPDDLDDLVTAVACIVTSTNGDVERAVSAMHAGASDYLQHPFPEPRLLAAIERACRAPGADQVGALDKFQIYGSSAHTSNLKAAIEKVAPTDSTVLIQGQSGTGKELVARAVHGASQRRQHPLISINCATVPAELIEAELFGTADGSQAGLVYAADRGTLFLDEIAELPAPAQARLLQIMQGQHRPLGAAESQAIDVRIIAATHRNLSELVESELFRQDLYYRLNVVCLQLLPLQQRERDVLEIAEWLLERTSSRLNKSALQFNQGAFDAMLAYHWPGNIRELENAIERAVILADNNSIIDQTLLAIEPASSAPIMTEPAIDAETSLEDYFVRFVQENQDQFTETELAEKLGISRKSLWERRQRLNIPRRKTRKRGPRRPTSS